ncbi:MAG: hypothetical protein MJZ39_01255 [Bacteroidales bacterium]|nr:hypothetical protein [Bacteroidales bacterium]
MKKYIWLLGICAILLASCSPKINGATPHRRDRHCGCENLSQPNTTPCQTTDEANYAYHLTD